MVDVTVKEMLEVGAHFGHQTRHWNPGMKPFIFGDRNGIHIINLEKTQQMCAEACRFLTRVVSEGGEVLFVGTKKQAQGIVEEEAKRCNMFHVTRRWLGGTLTNYRTIKASIDRLKNLEKKRTEGGLEGLTKREKLGVEREIENLTRALGGIKEMTRPPAAIFLIDPHKVAIAQHEAIRMKIPLIALADTNCDPRGIDYLIPANDDAIKSIRYFCHKIADACLEGVALRETVSRGRRGEEQDQNLPREKVIGSKGKAYVSKPEGYEETVTEYTSEKAANEGKTGGN